MNDELAIIIPVFNEEKTVFNNFLRIREELSKDDIFPAFVIVDDGSRDSTWARLCELSDMFSDTVCLRFSRNFGKEAAIIAGLMNICANRYLVIDSDLQHPPRYIKDMLAVMDRDGVDIVDGIKLERGSEGFLYKFFAGRFYKFLSFIAGIELNNSSDFKLMDRKVIESFKEFGEFSVFFRGLVYWSGFTKSKFYFQVDDRVGDSSKFSFLKLVVFAFNSVVSYTSKPLYFTVFLGLLFFLGAIILGIQTLYNYIAGLAVNGFTTVILIILITGAMIMISLGIIGVYISKIYNEIKRRPRYIISDRRNIDK